MKLVIDRKKWLRGESSLESYLLRTEDRKQCCIGILCSALGVPDNVLAGVRAIQSDPTRFVAFNLPTWLSEKSGSFEPVLDIYAAFETNDAMKGDTGYVSESDREQKITEIFAKHDIQVEFV